MSRFNDPIENAVKWVARDLKNESARVPTRFESTAGRALGWVILACAALSGGLHLYTSLTK